MAVYEFHSSVQSPKLSESQEKMVGKKCLFRPHLATARKFLVWFLFLWKIMDSIKHDLN